jgi:hypothetical protein
VEITDETFLLDIVNLLEAQLKSAPFVVHAEDGGNDGGSCSDEDGKVKEVPTVQKRESAGVRPSDSATPLRPKFLYISMVPEQFNRLQKFQFEIPIKKSRRNSNKN